MPNFDPMPFIAFAFFVVPLIGYLLYAKHRIEQLDRVIAEKEAVMNAPEQASATPR